MIPTARPHALLTALAAVLPAALAGLLASASPAVAQTWNVVGVIRDDLRGDPIAGAEITMADGRPLGVSQSTGRFEITVNNRRAEIVFRADGYRDYELNIGTLPRLIDVDIFLESVVQELDEVVARAPRRRIDPSQAQSIEELEAMQGMRMDLNDHLRQMHGVAGMNEFTSDISVHGSRTQDVTHYLGRSRVPSLRHLDFGFPGNQSVLNPRVLKSVTLADNMARGPLNQGNASALVYDLKDGDPEAIHGDVVLGSVNREVNLTSYWGERTFVTSLRVLDPNGLGAMGRRFFTTPKDARINPSGEPCSDANPCQQLEDPLEFTTGDFFFSTFKRDTATGGFGRHTLLVLDDNYTIREDKGRTQTEAVPQVLQQGYQGAWLYSYESVRPRETGDLEWGFSFLNRNLRDTYRDTTMPIRSNVPFPPADAPPWYPGARIPNVPDLNYDLGQGSKRDRQVILSGMWSPYEPFLGAMQSYGIEFEYTGESRRFRDYSTGVSPRAYFEIERDMTLVNALYRLRWNLGAGRAIETSAGVAWAQDAPRNGEDAESVPLLPMASLRYTHPIHEDHTLFAEAAGRHSAVIEPSGYNQLGIKVTPSVEGKLGGNGFLGEPVRYAWSGYTRWYDNPSLPDPEVFWNYAETREASHAVVQGANLTLTYLPGHHVGMGMNASIIQGQYSMRDGGTLPWESNRTLDLVSNVRILPRDDSLFSFILTYGIHNGAPLYEYRGLWDPDAGSGASTGQRAIYQSSNFPTVSRQRLDLRVNIDLKSDWRPLESMRFFFEANNIFADYDEGWASLLGGRNERRRGWTRDTENGELFPVVTRGLGLFLMFGIEGKLKI